MRGEACRPSHAVNHERRRTLARGAGGEGSEVCGAGSRSPSGSEWRSSRCSPCWHWARVMGASKRGSGERGGTSQPGSQVRVDVAAWRAYVRRPCAPSRCGSPRPPPSSPVRGGVYTYRIDDERAIVPGGTPILVQVSRVHHLITERIIVL
jgi:hypothetical protein